MRQVLITGGSGGIGRAVVNKFRQAGDQVTAPTRGELDLQSPAAVTRYCQEHRFDYDVLVYAAGINNPAVLEKLSDENIRQTWETNTMSFVQLCRAVTPAMRTRKHGHILVFSSVYGVVSCRGRLAYALSKHALGGAVQTLALEMGEDGILVNALCPGFVRTALTSKNNTPERIAALQKSIPLNRLAEPEEIAEAVYFLCSEKNTYITGQKILIDGGFSAGVSL